MKANKAILSSTQRAAEEATYKSDRFEELSSEYEALGKKIRNVPIDSTEYDQLSSKEHSWHFKMPANFPIWHNMSHTRRIEAYAAYRYT